MSNIENFDEQWHGHTGKEVENFIKEQFNNTNTTIVSISNNIPDKIPVSIDAETSNENVTIYLKDTDGTAIDSATFQIKADDSKDRIDFVVNCPEYIKKNGVINTLNCKFNLYIQGQEVPNQQGTLTISVIKNSISKFNKSYEVISNNNMFINDAEFNDLFIESGKFNVSFTISVQYNENEQPITKIIYKTIEVIDLSINSRFNYQVVQNNTNINVPFTVSGTGKRNAYLYIDSEQVDSKQTAISGNWSAQFTINDITPGKHSIQLIADNGTDNVKSNSIYMDMYVANKSDSYKDVGVSFISDNGKIFAKNEILVIEGEQYENVSFNYTGWFNEGTSMNAILFIGEEEQQISINQNTSVLKEYTFYTEGRYNIRFIIDENNEYNLLYNIKPNTELNIEERNDYILKLDAIGRSNTESNPAKWGNNSIFENFDWNTSGWSTDTVDEKNINILKVRNGAKLTIGMQPFNEIDVLHNGLTVEFKLKVFNVTNNDSSLISCGHYGNDNSFIGINIKGNTLGCYTGIVKEIPTPEEDEYGNPIINRSNEGVEMSYTENMWINVAFIIHPKQNDISNKNGLIELYINGVRSKVDNYTDTVWSIDDHIIIDSYAADIYIQSIRIYNTPIEDHDVLNNYIIDHNDESKIRQIIENNNILNDNNVNWEAIKDKDHAVMIFVMNNGIEDINLTNDKKADFLVKKAYWFAPGGEGNGEDFIAENFNIRIQGTSSVNYPRKNYRMYLAKTQEGYTSSLQVGKIEINEQGIYSIDNPTIYTGKNAKYKMRANSIDSNLFCLKCDFSDSSMVMNTGGAKLYNNIMKQLGLFTPPQNNAYDSPIRQAIDGIPCDLFIASQDNLSDIQYIGQYNFNNEKSKSDKIFGMNIDYRSFNPQENDEREYCPIALESLNNGNPFCLFQSAGSENSDALNNQLIQYFDAGFEFNYPEDTFFNPANIKDPEKENEANEQQKTAIKKLMGWIYDCVEESEVDLNNPDYGNNSTGWSAESKAKWVSSKFQNQINEHFDKNYLLTYYLITEYWGSVDQRAKNILWRTWDGNIWYPTFYDGDTAMGVRNDSYLVYNYDMNRDTWDLDHNKYAYEGHNSWLWCLVLANFEKDLATCADNLRNKLTYETMENMFTKEQQQNWCETLYNRSGEFKYIKPFIEGVQIKKDGVIITERPNRMYALTGNREAQRSLFLSERLKLIDAKYRIKSWSDTNNAVNLYLGVNTDETVSLTFTSNGDYSYGIKKLNGVDWVANPVEVKNNKQHTFTIFNSQYSANDPIRFIGVSKIKTLNLSNIIEHLGQEITLTNFKLLKELDAHVNVFNSTTSPFFNFEGCESVENINLNNLKNTNTINGLDGLTRLRIFKASNTNLQTLSFFPSAPIEELIIPQSIKTLYLKNHIYLNNDKLTIEGYDNLNNLIIVGCKNIDVKSILNNCNNLQRIRINVNDIISLDLLNKLKTIKGYSSNNSSVDYPALVGEVWLDRCASEQELLDLQNIYKELTIHQCEFSHYWYDDLQDDPANITNEDNKTGYAYYDPNTYVLPPNAGMDLSEYLRLHPNGYIPSGHISIIHDNVKPVFGSYNSVGNKLMVTSLSKNNFAKKEDNETDVDITDHNQDKDVFIYIPHYWYKGINDYKNNKKHFFLSANEECPRPSYKNIIKVTLGDLLNTNNYGGQIYVGKSTSIYLITEYGENLIIENENSLANSVGTEVVRINVSGMKQIRYPSINNDTICCIFTDENGKYISNDDPLRLTNINHNFFADDADVNYSYSIIPNGAIYCWFTCSNTAPDESLIILVDTTELDAIEPDWVEHKAECVGAYLGWFNRDSDGYPLSYVRSLSNKDITKSFYHLNQSPSTIYWQFTNHKPNNIHQDPTKIKFKMGHAEDAIYMSQGRGPGYSTLYYDTDKNLVNLFMVYFGTRKLDNFKLNIQLNPNGSYLTGTHNSDGLSDIPNNLARIWGIEYFWTSGSITTVFDGISFGRTWEANLNNERQDFNPSRSDQICGIVRNDGAINTIKHITLSSCAQATNNMLNPNGNVINIKFGRYCDTLPVRVSTTTDFVTYYGSGSGQLQQNTFVKGGNVNSQGLINYCCYVFRYNNVAIYQLPRLCYQGTIEFESN